jgi:hypothetical protein
VQVKNKPCVGICYMRLFFLLGTSVYMVANTY